MTRAPSPASLTDSHGLPGGPRRRRERRRYGGQHLSQYLREVPKPAVEDELDEN